jgi:phosphatidylserine/phosphatidylglycerophosphate/cardiolipin synthase-like enzyme
VKLIIQPDDGLLPLLQGVRRAKRQIDIVIFRFDRGDLEKALAAAVARKVVVRALIAHTNRGGEKLLRKLETRLLAAGVTVTRTADDLPRYHGKMMIADGRLFVLGFNYTKLDLEKSRSFGIVTTDRKLLKEAAALFEADRTRQPYNPVDDRLVVSPESSREVLTTFIKRARKQLLIYDEKVTDNHVQQVLKQRARAGVEIRIIGKTENRIDSIAVRKLAGLRLHVRAMVRDGETAFVGSQSLRRLELDGRREVGVLVTNAAVIRKMQAVFEEDWTRAGGKPLALPEAQAAKADEKEKDKAEKGKSEEKGEEKQKAAS